VPDAAPACDWTRAATWEFLPLDHAAFPAVALARRCGTAGRTYPAVYNAANEVCVEGFLKGHIPFPDIVETVARVVEDHVAATGDLTLADVVAADAWARDRAREVLPATVGGGEGAR
jgi:1-deoxy-D-xylulose-5-phosphate reductoisomerase